MKKQPWEARMDAFEQRMQTLWESSEKRHAARMDKIDRRLDSITKLMQVGANQLIRMEDAQRRFFENITRGNGTKKK